MSPESEPTDPAAARRRQARENAEYHHAAAARAAKAEARKTAPMVASFAEAMRSAGVEPTRLRARPYSGGGTLRTDVVGWTCDGTTGMPSARTAAGTSSS